MHTAWYDFKTHKKLLDMSIVTKLNASIGPAGLVGLDKLYSHMIKSDIEQFISSMEHNMSNEKATIDILNGFVNEMSAFNSTIPQPLKFYNGYTTKFQKISTKFLHMIVSIGQKQIIRKHITYELNSSCKFNSKNLESSLRTINE